MPLVAAVAAPQAAAPIAPYGVPAAAYGAPIAAYGAPMGPVGKVRGTGSVIVLTLVTLGFYSLAYFFMTHDEMKRHSGQGVGGALALILAIFVGFVSPFLLSSEVGGLYTRSGRQAPVSGATGLWMFLPVVGGFVWLVKTNDALNEYWKSLGAV